VTGPRVGSTAAVTGPHGGSMTAVTGLPGSSMTAATGPRGSSMTVVTGPRSGPMTRDSAGSGAVAGAGSGRLRGVPLAVPADGRGAATERALSRGRAGAEQGIVLGMRGGGARAATGGTRGRDGIPDLQSDSRDTFPA
jgi:hypothetical protein